MPENIRDGRERGFCDREKSRISVPFLLLFQKPGRGSVLSRFFFVFPRRRRRSINLTLG